MKFKPISQQPSQLFYRFFLAYTALMAAVLRFSHLAYLNFLVFDEKYFVKFAHQYLTGDSVFDSHPPLGKYLIALGIFIGDRLPFPHTDIQVDYFLVSPWSYRWFNALVGSLIPLIIAAIAYQLTHRYSYSVIAGFLSITDGLFLVESRLGLINIYMVLFGLLGQLCLLHTMNHPHKHRGIFLVSAGVNFGASVAVKWNGLGFLLSAYVLWFSHGLWLGFQAAQKHDRFRFTLPKVKQFYQLILSQFSQLFISPRLLFIYLGIIPAFVYCLCWIPHLQMNPDYGFWQVHQQIFNYHHNLGNGSKIHPYCSRWWTWPLMIRPVVYFYQMIQPSPQTSIIYTVLGMGNPILSWLSTSAIALLTALLIQQILIPLTPAFKKGGIEISPSFEKTFPRQRYIPYHSRCLAIWYYLIVNYLCNWLPWALVSRCTFLYHYMSAAVFAQLAIAWFIDYCLQAKQTYWRYWAIALIIIILLAFIFWLPFYLGLPLSPKAWQHRIWLSSWI
jgi:dolichyl-phosphate-mannose-protein mannosyltransferase